MNPSPTDVWRHRLQLGFNLGQNLNPEKCFLSLGNSLPQMLRNRDVWEFEFFSEFFF